MYVTNKGTSTKSQSGDFSFFVLLEEMNIDFIFFSVLLFLSLSISDLKEALDSIGRPLEESSLV